MAGYTFTLDRIQKRGPTSYAKNPPGDDPIPDYHDVKYKDDILVPGFDDYYISEDELKGCAAQNNFCESDSTALNYLTYYPDNINYDECKLPCILLFHAGGYSDCSTYKYEDSLCYVLARKGFVVFLIEYRRGRIKDAGTNYTSAQQLLALYRAFQDGRGAIRSIIKRQRNAGSSLPYQIDTNKIFVAGQSAGGTIANSLAYYRNQAMINTAFPVAPGDKSIEEVLGPIDADYYNGTPDIEYQSKIIGLWSMWTGFSIPMDSSNAHSEYNFLSNNGTWNLVPMIGMMGKKDDVFPITKQDQFVYYPIRDGEHDTYISESFCLIDDPFSVYGTNGKKQYRMECTNDIYAILKAHGIPTLQYLDCNMKHGLAHVAGDAICSTDFGAYGDTTTLNEVNEYLASRACFFFQSILNLPTAHLQGTSKFIDCQDYRHTDGSGSCVTPPNNDTCNNADTCD